MGWLADRIGRRPVSMLVFGIFPVFAYAIYNAPSMLVPLFWMPFVFLLTGSNVLMRIVATELFPTSSRNTAVGWESLNETLGAAGGFLLENCPQIRRRLPPGRQVERHVPQGSDTPGDETGGMDR